METPFQTVFSFLCKFATDAVREWCMPGLMHDRSSPFSASAWFTFKAVATAARDSNASRLSKALGASLAEQVQACLTHVLRTDCCELLKGRTLAAWCLPKPESCRLVMKAICCKAKLQVLINRYMHVQVIARSAYRYRRFARQSSSRS